MLAVGDVMTRNPEHVRTTAPIREAANRLYELDVRHLPVVDDHGELVGVLSDRDVRDHSQPYEIQIEDPTATSEREEQPVSNIMQGDVLYVDPEDDIDEVIDLMINQKIGAVPVVDSIEGNLVGIVSYVDILRVARDEI